MNIQQFESKRQVVEAVQLTADADWEAIAEWCDGTVTEVVITFGGLEGLEIAVLGDWIVRDGSTFKSRTDGELLDEFQPVSESDDIASEIRTALEGTTPGPWEWGRKDYTLDGPDGVTVLSAENNVMWWDNAQDGELIAAAPDLLARAANRIEQLEERAPKLDRNLLHCIDHFANDVEGGERMRWASNDDLRAILEYLDLVIAKGGA